MSNDLPTLPNIFSSNPWENPYVGGPRGGDAPQATGFSYVDKLLSTWLAVENVKAQKSFIDASIEQARTRGTVEKPSNTGSVPDHGGGGGVDGDYRPSSFLGMQLDDMAPLVLLAVGAFLVLR